MSVVDNFLPSGMISQKPAINGADLGFFGARMKIESEPATSRCRSNLTKSSSPEISYWTLQSNCISFWTKASSPEIFIGLYDQI